MLSSTLLTLTALQMVSAGTVFYKTPASDNDYNLNSNQNVAVWWASNATSLADTCKEDSINMVMISSVTAFQPDLTLSQDVPANFSQQIRECQSLGKKVLLSVGSDQKMLESDVAGVEAANQLWNVFGSGESKPHERLFGDAIVDGFELAPDAKDGTGWAAFARQMKQNFNSQTCKSDYMLVASPHMSLPDPALHEAITQSDFDMVIVRAFEGETVNNKRDEAGDFGDWVDFVAQQSHNQTAKLMLGAPASRDVVKSGYYDPNALVNTVNTIRAQYCSFSGVALWDANAALENTLLGVEFVKWVKFGMFNGIECPKPEPVAGTATFYVTTVVDPKHTTTHVVTNTVKPTPTIVTKTITFTAHNGKEETITRVIPVGVVTIVVPDGNGATKVVTVTNTDTNTVINTASPTPKPKPEPKTTSTSTTTMSISISTSTSTSTSTTKEPKPEPKTTSTSTSTTITSMSTSTTKKPVSVPTKTSEKTRSSAMVSTDSTTTTQNATTVSTRASSDTSSALTTSTAI